MDDKHTLSPEAETAEAQERTCSKCNGQMKEASFEIINSLSIDFGHALLGGPKQFFYLNPKRRSPICLTVCQNCGFIESYAERPRGL